METTTKTYNSLQNDTTISLLGWKYEDEIKWKEIGSFPMHFGNAVVLTESSPLSIAERVIIDNTEIQLTEECKIVRLSIPIQSLGWITQFFKMCTPTNKKELEVLFSKIPQNHKNFKCTNKQ